MEAHEHEMHHGHDEKGEPGSHANRDTGRHEGSHGGRADHSGQTHHGGHGHHAAMVEEYKRRFLVSLGMTVPILALSPMIQEWLGVIGALSFPGDVYVLLALSSFVYLYGGWPFLTGLVDELRDRRPGMMTLVGFAISVAFIYSTVVVLGVPGELFFWETATLIDLMLVGHWIEMRSVMGASRALEELARLMPAEAHRVREDGTTEDIPLSELAKGDRVRVKSGEKIPADGTVVEGRSDVNESLLTGESEPADKSEGDEVIAGSINGRGSLVVEVGKTGEESYLNQVITLVREAQSTKSRTQDLANRAAFYLTIVALSVGSATFVAWLVLSGESLTFAVERAVTVMVITCPHALGLAIPLVVAVSTSISARKGLLIRNRTAFERARDVDTIVFDKTGTLTEGRFGVTDIIVYANELDEEDVLRLAAAVEQHSEHPIAAGVMGSADERGLKIPSAQDFEALTGRGVRASIEGSVVRILSPGALDAEGLATEAARNALEMKGKTVIFVVRDDQLLGAIALADVIRPSSRDAVTTLQDIGIDVVMLTGDRQEVADWVAEELALDRVIAEVLPNEKSDVIRRLQAEGRIVAMTGDGVNDAPALATADVGIAIGAGTDVAVETADVILVDSDPKDVVQVIRLARATYKKMVQNLWYAAGYNVVAIPLAAGALVWAGIVLSPAMGAVLMSLSTVVVAINARLLRID